MPIYEYHCSKCGDFEVMQRISDKELRTCPTCRRKVTKLISNTTFHLKGSGWYITDYARKGKGGTEPEKKSDTTADSTDSSASSSSSSSKTDTKSESTTDSKTDSTTASSKSTSKKSTGTSKGKKSTKAKSAA